MNSLSRKHFLRLALAVAAVAAAGSAPNVFAAEDVVEITVAHPYGKIFRPIHQKIIKEFNKIHPNVKVRLETPFPDYEELTQRTLAGIAQGNAPVLSFQGINQIRQYIEMGAAYDLSEFVKNDPRWKDGSGYYPTMMKLGNFNGKQYAVPFAISTPIVYFNETLLKKAGIDTSKGFETWPALIEAAKKVQALGPEYSGLFYDYQATGNWMWQALLFCEGGTMMDEKETRSLLPMNRVCAQRVFCEALSIKA